MAITDPEITNEEVDQIDTTIYEVSFLLDTNLSDEDASAKHAEFKAFLEEKGAEIIEEGKLDQKKLAYTMSVKRDSKRKDHSKAYFSWIKFAVNSDEIAGFDQLLKADSAVIRFLIIKTTRESMAREQIEGIDDMEETASDEDEIVNKPDAKVEKVDSDDAEKLEV